MTNKKYSILQIIITIVFFAILFFINYLVNQYGVPVKNKRGILLFTGLFFLDISWVYLMTSIQIRKRSQLLEAANFKKLTKIVVIMATVFAVVLLVLAYFDLIQSLIEPWKGIFYLILVYIVVIYFYFVMSLVYKFSENKNRVIHYTYGWSLAIIIVKFISF